MSVRIKGRRPIAKRLDNSGSYDLNVDGSSTPQIFSFDALSADNAIITDLEMILEDNAAIDFGNRFMGLGTGSNLTNGIDIDIKSDGQVINIITIKSTRGLLRYASPGGFQYEQGAGFRYIVKTTRHFRDGLILKRGSDDYVKITINDDLTGLTYGVATVFGHRI